MAGNAWFSINYVIQNTQSIENSYICIFYMYWMAHSEHGHEHKEEHAQKHTALWLIVTILTISITVPALLLILTVIK